MADVLTLFVGTDANSRANMNKRFSDANKAFGEHGAAIETLKTSTGADHAALGVHVTDAVKHITTTERTDWNNRVKKSTSVDATLTAAGWVGAAAPFTQTLSVAAVTATSANEVLRPLALTEVIRETWDAAAFADGGQSAGKLTVAAWGEKPTINLPCRIIIRGDL